MIGWNKGCEETDDKDGDAHQDEISNMHLHRIILDDVTAAAATQFYKVEYLLQQADDGTEDHAGNATNAGNGESFIDEYPSNVW